MSPERRSAAERLRRALERVILDIRTLADAGDFGARMYERTGMLRALSQELMVVLASEDRRDPREIAAHAIEKARKGS